MKEHGWGSKQIDKGQRQIERSSREGWGMENGNICNVSYNAEEPNAKTFFCYHLSIYPCIYFVIPGITITFISFLIQFFFSRKVSKLCVWESGRCRNRCASPPPPRTSKPCDSLYCTISSQAVREGSHGTSKPGTSERMRNCLEQKTCLN
jgi:hypothetical protein